MNAIELKSVGKRFKNKVLYNDVNISIEKGGAVGIVGGNASGKSVLFKLMTGLEKPTTGEVFVNDERLGVNTDFPKNVGIMVNSPGYIDYYSGFKNLMLLAQIQNKVGESEVKKAMKCVGLDPDEVTHVKNYSMGMKQKLGIAQAFMENQDIILLDEPFNALDFKTNGDIMDVLFSLKAEGKTLIMTSHQHDYLEKICNMIYIIEDQRIVPLSDELKQKYFMK
jgi:ABC-2 type transport system ATP-binding protein